MTGRVKFYIGLMLLVAGGLWFLPRLKVWKEVNR